MGCHLLEGGTEQRRRAVMTDAEQERLWDKMYDTGLGKMFRKTKGKGPIAKHYREELKRMQGQRADGEIGRIEFECFL